MSADTDFWCAAPDGFGGEGEDAAELWREQSSPLVSQGGKEVRDQCNIWNSTNFQRPPDNETKYGNDSKNAVDSFWVFYSGELIFGVIFQPSFCFLKQGHGMHHFGKYLLDNVRRYSQYAMLTELPLFIPGHVRTGRTTAAYLPTP